MTEQKKQQILGDLQLALQISQAKLNGFRNDTKLLAQTDLPAGHVATAFNLSTINVEHVGGIITKLNKGILFLVSREAQSIEWHDVQGAMESTQE